MQNRIEIRGRIEIVFADAKENLAEAISKIERKLGWLFTSDRPGVFSAVRNTQITVGFFEIREVLTKMNLRAEINVTSIYSV